VSQSEKSQGGAPSRNEGEGNRTAARQYNEAQRNFIKSTDVEQKAREAEQAVEGREKRELDRAEAIGKRHSHGEDPEVTRKS
jgi:hypothetical protein